MPAVWAQATPPTELSHSIHPAWLDPAVAPAATLPATNAMIIMHTEEQKDAAFKQAIANEGWPINSLVGVSEGSLAQACFDAGYSLGATPPVQLPTIFVETGGGLFICALSAWAESGLSLRDFLYDNGVLGDDDIDLRDMTVTMGTRTQQELDALPEWPA
jgi:hypothetical protein